MTHVLAVLIRFAALVVVLAGYYAALPLLFPGDQLDANIGAGLIAFGAIALVALVGGFLDGRRSAVVRVGLLWTVVGLLVGVGFPIALQIGPGSDGIDGSTFLLDLSIFVPMCAFLVGVPAVAGAAAGALTRRARVS